MNLLSLRFLLIHIVQQIKREYSLLEQFKIDLARYNVYSEQAL